MTIEDRLAAFITSSDSGALAIVGKWGQGKTYFWRLVANKLAPKAKKIRKNYAYVSLFGIASLADLRIELAQQIRPVEYMTDETFGALLIDPTIWTRIRTKEWWKATWAKLARVFRSGANVAASASVAAPHIGNLGPLYRGWAYSRVKDCLICLDDLERRGAALPLKDVLGLVSQLVTERRCAVAVIFNEGTLNAEDEAVWRENSEKVFLGEVRYSVSATTCASYVFDSGVLTELETFARTAVLEMGLKNVRIIQRIRVACDQISGCIEDSFTEDTKRHVARSLALYVYAKSGQGEGAPPPEEVRKSTFERAMDRMNRAQGTVAQTPEHRRWSDILDAYGCDFSGELDACLADGVDQGFPDLERLAHSVSEFDSSIRSQQLDAAYSAAWEHFHESLEDNHAEVVAEMAQSFFRLKATVKPMSADGTIRLVRAFGEDDLADRMVREWIEERSTPERWKELEQREVEIFSPLEDQHFKHAVEATFQHWLGTVQMSFDELLRSIQPDRYITEPEFDILARASTEDFIRFYKANPQRSTAKALTHLLLLESLPDRPNRDQIKSTVSEALLRLAEENPTNRVRIPWKFPTLASQRTRP